MSDNPSFDIRYSILEDLPFLQQWFEDPVACDDFPFGTAEKEEALKNWIGFSRFKAGLTGTIEGAPCAIGTLFLMPYKKIAHHSSFFLMVDPKHRCKGIGTSMVRNLLHLAKTRFRLESVHVELFEPNVLIPILQKLRFETFGRQENFVHTNGSRRARVLMEHFFYE